MASNTRNTSAIVESDTTTAAANTSSSIVETNFSTDGPKSTTIAANMMILTQAQYDVLQAQIVAAQLTTGPTLSSVSGLAPSVFKYRGKKPKSDKYYSGFCGKYNTFIEHYESNFILKDNNSDAG